MREEPADAAAAKRAGCWHVAVYAGSVKAWDMRQLMVVMMRQHVAAYMRQVGGCVLELTAARAKVGVTTMQAGALLPVWQLLRVAPAPATNMTPEAADTTHTHRALD